MGLPGPGRRGCGQRQWLCVPVASGVIDLLLCKLGRKGMWEEGGRERGREEVKGEKGC